MMGSLWMTLVLAAAAPEPQYGVAAFEPNADQTPQRVLSLWDALLVERGLSPDLVDHKAAVALGEWLSRPHVCSGMVRYHAVVAAERTLKVLVVAECSGQGQGLDKAAQGLADELNKRLGGKGGVLAATVKDVPARLWEQRVQRGNTNPPATPNAAPPSPGTVP